MDNITPELCGALLAFHKECPKLTHNKEVGTGKYKFTYADLPHLLETIRLPLAKHGLFVVQTFGSVKDDNSDNYLVTTLYHESGGWLDSWCPIQGTTESGNTLKAFGAAITYMRRYGITALLGLSVCDDKDGDELNHEAPAKQKPRASNAADPAPLKELALPEYADILIKETKPFEPQHMKSYLKSCEKLIAASKNEKPPHEVINNWMKDKDYFLKCYENWIKKNVDDKGELQRK